MARFSVFIYLVCSVIGSIIGFISQDSISGKISFIFIGLLAGELIGVILCSLLHLFFGKD